MAFTKFANLDYDQIKTQIKDYLRANSNFTGFDYEGSNFSVLIDLLAYNDYINAVNANLIVNESFLDSATVRRNVVSLAGNIGYLPRSKRAAQAQITFSVQTTATTPSLTLKAGLVATGSQDNTDYVFSIPEDITATVENGIAQFGTEDDPITIYQGTYLKNQFVFNGSLDQRFIIPNSSMDYHTLVVRIKLPDETGPGNVWRRAQNILRLDENSEIYFVQEVENEFYELIFGDGIFGKALQNNEVIDASYIVTNGLEGNGPANFTFAGSLANSLGAITIPSQAVDITTIQSARNGGNIESVESIKYFAPRTYSAQDRAVTSRDYEAIIKKIYPNTESVAVVGGEELDPPRFGNVFISIKPINGLQVSDFDQKNILDALKDFAIAGIDQQILELKILFVELESSVYFNNTKVGSPESLKTAVIQSLNEYSNSIDLNKFGGRFKYSKTQKIIDDTDVAITSNITLVIIRRNLNAVLNNFSQYELCYGNAFNIIPAGGTIKSTGFKIFGVNQTVYLTDIPNKTASGELDGSGKGVISLISPNPDSSTGQEYLTIVENAGTVDYTKGEVILTTIRIVETVEPDNIIEVQAYPQSNDVIGLKDLYVSLSIPATQINMIKDTIASGEQTSGVGFKVTSSYGNGSLIR